MRFGSWTKELGVEELLFPGSGHAPKLLKVSGFYQYAKNRWRTPVRAVILIANQTQHGAKIYLSTNAINS